MSHEHLTTHKKSAEIQPHIAEIIAEQCTEAISQAVNGKVDEALTHTIERMLEPIIRKEDLKRKIYLTEREVAELYPLTPDALRTMRSRRLGGPSYVKEGKRILYPQKELRAYFDSKIKKMY